jgi:hypothetical protein
MRPSTSSALLVHTKLNYENIRGVGRPRDAEWIARRIDLYLRYSVPSLRRQTVRDFIVWLDCRPGSERDLEAYLPALHEAGVRVTFDGGRELLASFPGEVEHFYITRLDSDDLYAPDAIELISRLHGEHRASQFYRGYTYDLASGAIHRVARRSPPFYSLRFARDEASSSRDFSKWLAPMGSMRGHNVVRDRLRPVPLPDARFCCLRHDANAGQEPRGESVEAPYARREIRSRFGLNCDTPLSLGGPQVRRLLNLKQPPAEGDVAVLLTSWRRPLNLPQQIRAICDQTVRPRELAVWHNGPQAFDGSVIPPGLPVTVVSSSRNAGVWPRFLWAMEFESPFVCVFDDDAIPGRRWLENCLRCMENKEGLYGTAGVVFTDGSRASRKYIGWRKPSKEAVECDIAGHSWFFKRDWLRYYALEPRRGEFDHGEDYHFSMTLQKHLRLGTYVPPHPPDDREWWGSTNDRLGRDQAASWRQPGAEILKQATHDAYIASGWRPIALRTARSAVV